MPYKGYFTPQNTKKYLGDPTKIYFRSLWERKIMQWCDRDQSVLEWASEEIIIPYFCPTDNKRHKYYPDFYIKTINNGKIRVQLVEVKPKKQTEPPKFRKNTRKKRIITESKAWAKNTAKWKAAKKYCEIKNWEFHIITENHPLLRMYKR